MGWRGPRPAGNLELVKTVDIINVNEQVARRAKMGNDSTQRNLPAVQRDGHYGHATRFISAIVPRFETGC